MAQEISSLVSKIMKIPVEVVVTCAWYMSHVLCDDGEILLLRDQLKSLEESRFRIRMDVDASRRYGGLISSEVLIWLEKANAILEKGEIIFEIREARRNYFCDIRTRYKLARIAKKMMLDINSLPQVDIYASLEFDNWEENQNVMVNQESIRDAVLKELKDANILGVDVAAGNSERVAIHVYKTAKGMKLFDEVVMVNVVSTHPNSYKIQCDLEKKLGLEFARERENSLSERGKIVHERLLHSRVLVILYNVKEKFELRDVGFQSENLGRSKVVVISSKSDVCQEMGIQRRVIIPKVRDQDDWDIFKTMAGDWVQKADRECIAYEFVKQYCGGDSDISSIANDMNEWIKIIENSNGINVPDAHEINTRRMKLFTVAAAQTR